MTPLSNDRLLRALRVEPVDCTPVWLMRQAGRYLPEYRATRERAGSFIALCRTPELACEVTLQPLQRFDLDAAILFSDILVLPDAMGLGLSVNEGVGPRFERPLRTTSDIRALGVPDPGSELRYVMDAVALIQRALSRRVPLIGFAGSPWTLATYMIEGGPSEDYARVKGLLYAEPRLMHELLATLARAVAEYLNGQIRAGVDAVMVFDTWGGILTEQDFLEFSLEYMRRVIENLDHADNGSSAVPTILFTKGGGAWLRELARTGCSALGLDWTRDIGAVRAEVGDRIALQGNLDPAVLRAPADVIRERVQRILRAHGPGPGHVFNLGHGITPNVDPAAVTALVDAVHEFGCSPAARDRA